MVDNSQNEGSINILECHSDCEILLDEGNSQNKADVQDTEFMHDPDMTTTQHCPAQCPALINNNLVKLVINTGAGGCVVSSK